MRRWWEIVRVGLVVAVVAICAYAGFSDGMNSWRSAVGAAQRVVVTTQLLYGALSVGTLVAMAFRPAWVTPLLVAWGAALTVTGSLATVVWGGAGWPAAAAAAVSIIVVVALILWAWRSHRRSVGSPHRG